MKKTAIVLALALLGAAPAVFAQEENESKQYLPEKGDFAIGFDIVPLIKTIGGSYTTTEVVPVGGTPFEYEEMFLRPNVSLNGKYMLTDKWGLKLNVGVAFRSADSRAYSPDDYTLSLYPNSHAQVVDNAKLTQSGGTFSFGGEYRFGKRRVQGIVGFGVLAGFSTFKTTYSYGNQITGLNREPSQSFGGVVEKYDLPGYYRATEISREGPNGCIGVYGSAGVEWFVAPKIALGAEVDLNFVAAFAGKGVAKYQGYNEAYDAVENFTQLVSPGGCSFDLGTHNVGGSLYMNFYFK